MADPVKTLTAFIYFDFQFQDPTSPDPNVWCSNLGVWEHQEDALAAAVGYEQQTGRKTRLLQCELYRTVL